ncbi:hypothetical protein EP10_000596 [Geobacillus icigianus]|uniref:Uncharacterized protein n=1 Tax=Geobacillus icigianus TaxID=1430331 RepID=A0ABU6BCV1_9BACL|nr:hypothetical protein B4113_2668 [Geobacillus sp. B4113_201601]MEB3749757.1 hypothetical protein [Geobacillus icigianus]
MTVDGEAFVVHSIPVPNRILIKAERFEQVAYETKEQFLRDVLALELSFRQKAKQARLIKKAKFRELKWLNDDEWSDQIH